LISPRPTPDQVEVGDCDMNLCHVETCLEFGLPAVEEFGRPMPTGYYPATWQQAKIDDFEASISADHEIYMLVPWDEPKPEVKLLSENIATQGGAARSEWTFIQQMERWIDVRLTGSAQAIASGARRRRGAAGRHRQQDARDERHARRDADARRCRPDLVPQLAAAAAATMAALSVRHD
jgi:hypothetical protein